MDQARIACETWHTAIASTGAIRAIDSFFAYFQTRRGAWCHIRSDPFGSQRCQRGNFDDGASPPGVCKLQSILQLKQLRRHCNRAKRNLGDICLPKAPREHKLMSHRIWDMRRLRGSMESSSLLWFSASIWSWLKLFALMESLIHSRDFRLSTKALSGTVRPILGRVRLCTSAVLIMPPSKPCTSG